MFYVSCLDGYYNSYGLTPYYNITRSTFFSTHNNVDERITQRERKRERTEIVLYTRVYLLLRKRVVGRRWACGYRRRLSLYERIIQAAVMLFDPGGFPILP